MKFLNTPRILQNLVKHLKVHKLDSVITKEAEKQIEFLDLNMLKVTTQISNVDEALKVAIIHSSGSSREQLQGIYSDFLDIKTFIAGGATMTDNKFLSNTCSKEDLLALLD